MRPFRHVIIPPVLAALAPLFWNGLAFAQDELPIISLPRAPASGASTRLSDLFRHALAEVGHEDGRTIRLIEHFAESRLEKLPDLARAIAAECPCVVVIMGLPAAHAVQVVTSPTPIIALTGFWVELEFAQSLSQPGGNLTDLNVVATELDAMRLSLFRELLTTARRIAILPDHMVHHRLTSNSSRQAPTASSLQSILLICNDPRRSPRPFGSPRAVA
jgi:putative ABC transport system substrate-binding protein